MPKHDDDERDSGLKETMVKTKTTRRCHCSRRCKICLCTSLLILTAVGIGIADIYYRSINEDGSNDLF